jgi:hypothetical protein
MRSMASWRSFGRGGRVVAVQQRAFGLVEQVQFVQRPVGSGHGVLDEDHPGPYTLADLEASFSSTTRWRRDVGVGVDLRLA